MKSSKAHFGIRASHSLSNRIRAAAGALALVAAASLLLAAPLCFAGGISNLRVSQREGTNLVDLRYDLATGGAYPMLVTVAVSTNGGNTYDLPATHFTGEVGYGVTAGTNKLIVWDAVQDWPDRFSTNVFFRLNASDQPPGMALVPAGPFTMGDTFGEGGGNELPLHTLQVSAFYMDQFKVTKALWDEVLVWANTHGYDLGSAGLGKAATHPVHSVTWYDVVKWCNARSEREGRVPAYYTSATLTTVYRTGQTAVQNGWVKWSSGYRLPTEAEWEKAARGGANGQRFPWGNTITHSQANYYSSTSYAYDTSPTRGYHPSFQAGGEPYTSPVGYFAANGYGLYDMSGNLWEWTWDWSGSYSAASATDPRGPTSGSFRVVRGGHWYGSATVCRSADRYDRNPGNRWYYHGFRVVLPLGQP
jgi:formylglycine-generating enzyme required for sulfatase activity